MRADVYSEETKNETYFKRGEKLTALETTPFRDSKETALSTTRSWLCMLFLQKQVLAIPIFSPFVFFSFYILELKLHFRLANRSNVVCRHLQIRATARYQPSKHVRLFTCFFCVFFFCLLLYRVYALDLANVQ